MADFAELKIGNKTIQLPIVVGTEGEQAIDIQKLREETGFITLDPGYANTGSCRSAITFIDGEKGILRYRGYSIEELAAKSTFLEVAHLLMWGELPTKQRISLLHRFVNDLPYADIGRIVGCSEAAARQNVRAGLASLRGAWEQ